MSNHPTDLLYKRTCPAGCACKHYHLRQRSAWRCPHVHGQVGSSISILSGLGVIMHRLSHATCSLIASSISTNCRITWDLMPNGNDIHTLQRAKSDLSATSGWILSISWVYFFPVWLIDDVVTWDKKIITHAFWCSRQMYLYQIICSPEQAAAFSICVATWQL